ncbi:MULTISPECIES: hypothetical protein [Actinosynnema]|uniref:hypothetical protein n=1 Tax=Actinosynnema TaxID=40566 RepID=UPI0020A49452|nr:hypothetical protein [Actinosynnema pretiosum]
MKRLGIALLALGFLLSGCSSEWQEDVRFKVIELHPAAENKAGELQKPYARMVIDQAEPKWLGPKAIDLDQLPVGLEVDDVLVCSVRRYDDNGFDDVEAKVTVGPCKTA